MKKAFAIASLSALLAFNLQAGVITVTNVPATGAADALFVADSSGTLLPANSGSVGIGFFAGGDAAVTGASSGSDIIAGFTQFSDSVGISFSSPVPGLYLNQISGAINDGGFDGQSIYTVIGDGGTLASSSQWAVYKHDVSFPAEGANPNAAVESAILGAGNALIGTLAPSTFNGNDVNALWLDGFGGAGPGPVIPEPSSALLALLGFSFMGFRRRR